MNVIFSLTTLLILLPLSCSSGNDTNGPNDDVAITNPPITFYYGADLSYVNEMEDCGAIYKDQNNAEKDPFVIFKEAGSCLGKRCDFSKLCDQRHKNKLKYNRQVIN